MTMAKEMKSDIILKFSPEEVKFVLLSDIYVDTGWNVRSFANVMSEKKLEGDTETAGIKGLAASIESDGQDTPIILRASNDVEYKKNIKEPYALVAGFRREEAFKILNTPENIKKATDDGRTVIPGVANGYIKAIVRKLNDKDARLLNTRENTGREKLETPDLMYAVLNLMGGNNRLTTTQIGTSLGIAQSYASRLGKIGSSLDKNVFNHWRSGGLLNNAELPNKQLSIEDIEEVSRAPKERQVEAYTTALKGAAEDDKSKTWWTSSQKKAEKLGAHLGGIVKTGLFIITADDIASIDWYGLIESGKLFKLHKEIKLKRQKESLAKLAEKAFITEFNRDETESDNNEDEDLEDTGT